MKKHPVKMSRRSFSLGVTASAALLPVGISSSHAKSHYESLLEARTNGAPLQSGKISLEMPDLAENGSLVPFTIKVEGNAAHVKAIYVFAPLNPAPEVGQFYFTAESGEALVISRMRLGKPQDVVAVAEMKDGTFYTAKKHVKVTVGGCG